MKGSKDFIHKLSDISGIAISDTYCRFIAVSYLNDPLAAIQSKIRGGRYNFKGKFEALYIAPDPVVAIQEGLKQINFKFPPKAIVTIEADVKHIVDLEDKIILKALSIDRGELLKPWRQIQKEGKEAYTQTLGRLIYESEKFEGIRYPSAKIEGKYNLVIFPDRLKEVSQINVYDPDKILKKIMLSG